MGVTINSVQWTLCIQCIFDYNGFCIWHQNHQSIFSKCALMTLHAFHPTPAVLLVTQSHPNPGCKCMARFFPIVWCKNYDHPLKSWNHLSYCNVLCLQSIEMVSVTSFASHDSRWFLSYILTHKWLLRRWPWKRVWHSLSVFWRGFFLKICAFAFFYLFQMFCFYTSFCVYIL